MFEEFQHHGITYTCHMDPTWLLQSLHRRFSDHEFSDAHNYCVFNPVLCSFVKKFAMPMVKVVLLARTLFIFILFCREGSNRNKNPKPKKGISNILRSCTIYILNQFLKIYSWHPVPKSSVHYRAAYLYSCVFMGPLFSSLFLIFFCPALIKTHRI